MPINCLLRVAFTGIFVFLGAWIGLEQTVTPDGIAILWPANAVLLAALLQTPQSDWPLLTFAGLIAFSAAILSASFPLWSVSLFSLVNLAEVLIAAILIRWFAGTEFEFQSLRGMTVFLLAGPLVACSLAAILSASIFEALARTANPLVLLWRLWWFSDAVGMIILTPLLVSVWNLKIPKSQTFSKKQLMGLAELAVIWTGVAIVGIHAFHTARHGDIEFFLAPVLLLGLATWTAIRLGILATTATVTLIAALFIAFLVQPTPFFTATTSAQDAVWLTQEYLVVISLLAVGLSGLMQAFRDQRASLLLKDRALAKETEERLKNAASALQQDNELLEEKVQERTISLQKANEELKKVASLDFLTGIANRRHFYELGQRELKRLQIDGLTASLIAFDLDNFKAINDTYGHEAGDQILRQIVTPVENIIRPADSFGRIGGDEFLILFTDTPERKAVEVAERICTEIAKVLSSFGSGKLGVTASFGVAGWDKKCELGQLIHRADMALYNAKKHGRNRVCTWHPGLDRQADASGLSQAG